jgi:hypothetical protein
MAKFSKLLVALVGTCCLQTALSDKALAQFANLDLDRATIQDAVGVQRMMANKAGEQASGQYSDPGVVSPTQSLTNSDSYKSELKPQLRPALKLPFASANNADAAGGASKNPYEVPRIATPTGNFTVPAPKARAEGNIKIAQVQPAASTTNNIVPIDLEPVRLPTRSSTFTGIDAFKTQSYYHLPGRVFLNASVENSLRFELNTFQTNRHYLSDMVYRVLPSIDLGYALTKKTRISANYFFLRDQYDLRNKQLSRNFHSVGARIDHDVNFGQRNTLTFGFMPRVLFIQASHAPDVVYNDLLPSIFLKRRVNNGVIYGGVLGQIRFRDILSHFQEGDQFYSLGGSWLKGQNSFVADTTLVTNFGNSTLRQGPNNQNIIMTFEAGRRIHPRLPLTAFVRAQPIFNIGANHSPGYAGFNFRIFGGIRADLAKPAIFPVKLKQS